MFQDFRNSFNEQRCFTIHQVKLVYPNFDTKNLNRWQKKAYVEKLRNGLYTFSDNINEPSINLYFANHIYKPSYISLQFALNYYGIIPEFIPIITSVSTLKTNNFSNSAGDYEYKNLKKHMFFGYEIKKAGNFEVIFASIEKAIVDFFYLYPEYNNESEIANLRFDAEILMKSLDIKKLDKFVKLTQNRQLANRIKIMKKTYKL